MKVTDMYTIFLFSISTVSFKEISLKIYPKSLALTKTNDTSLNAKYLDLKILLSNTVEIPIYDKQNSFPLKFMNLLGSAILLIKVSIIISINQMYLFAYMY